MPRSPFVVLVAGLAASVAAGQQPSQPRPTFRTGVEYVELDAVVTDKQGRAVTELTAEDFEIVERGRTQAIAGFQFIDIPAVRRPVPDVKAAAPTIDVVSNAHPPTARQWVLVVDDLHILEQHILHTKKVVQQFLESLPEDDQVAVVFVGRSDLSQDFTSDLGAQIRTVNRIKDALGFAYDAADQGGASVVASAAERDLHRYGMASVDVLINICRAVARSTYPRKAIVYVSEGMTYSGFPSGFYQGDFIDGWHRAIDIATKSGVPIYAIDPRGAPDCTSVRGECAVPPWPNIRNQWDRMHELADNTGGRTFVNNSDIERAVRELVEDNNSFYLLGYYPDPLEHDGKFHDVRVKVRGRDDLRVRARAGYTAAKPAKATSTETKTTLDEVLAAGLPVAGLQLRAAAAPVAIAEKGMKTAVTLEVTYPALPETKFDDTLQFAIIALDHDGKIKASTRGTYQYTATPTAGTEVAFAINATVTLPSQPLTLRIGVASQALDRAASIHVPVEVINPSRDVLQIGSVVLGFAGAPRQTAVPANALKGLVPIQPTMLRTFAASEVLQIYAPLFWRASTGGSALATISVKRGDAVVKNSRVDLTGEGGTVGRQRVAAVNGNLPLTGLAAGAYMLEIAGRLDNGMVARRSVAFAIR